MLAGARADIGTVAATLALPGPTRAPSAMSTQCTIGMDAHLDWIGEPMVSVVGSDPTITTVMDLGATATCRVVEEVLLGRSGEPSGRLQLVLRFRRAGRPLVHNAEEFGPNVAGAGSVVSTGGAQHLLSEVLVGVDAGESRVSMSPTCRAAWLPVAADAVVILAVGVDRPSVRSAVANLRRDPV